MRFNPNNPPVEKVVSVSAIRVANKVDEAFVAPSDIEVSNACDSVATTLNQQGLAVKQIREVRDEWMVVEVTLLVDKEEGV